MLFSNVHVQHDLPFAYEKMGIETRSGRSRKPDHDAVNEVNARVFDGIEKYIAAHYDPSFSLIDMPFVPVEEIGALELVKSWREQAWRSAERLLAADSPPSSAEVAATIRENVDPVGRDDLLRRRRPATARLATSTAAPAERGGAQRRYGSAMAVSIAVGVSDELDPVEAFGEAAATRRAAAWTAAATWRSSSPARRTSATRSRSSRGPRAARARGR